LVKMGLNNYSLSALNLPALRTFQEAQKSRLL